MPGTVCQIKLNGRCGVSSKFINESVHLTAVVQNRTFFHGIGFYLVLNGHFPALHKVFIQVPVHFFIAKMDHSPKWRKIHIVPEGFYILS